MPKERVDVLAYKQGLFETREQAKRGVMAGLVVNVINGERYDKPGEKIDDATELKLKGEKLKKLCKFLRFLLMVKQRLILVLQQVVSQT